MKFEITLNADELNNFSRKVVPNLTGLIEIIIAGSKFECDIHTSNKSISMIHGEVVVVEGTGFDKKVREIAQAKAEVNRTKEAHKEAQRKLSALMEEGK